MAESCFVRDNGLQVLSKEVRLLRERTAGLAQDLVRVDEGSMSTPGVI